MTEQPIENVVKTDFYLKLPSEQSMETIFEPFYKQEFITQIDEETGEQTEVPQDNPHFVPNTKHYAIDVVGIIHEQTGNTITDSDGNTYPETAPLDGWHVNIRLIDDQYREFVEQLDQTYGVTPETPSRVWL